MDDVWRRLAEGSLGRRAAGALALGMLVVSLALVFSLSELFLILLAGYSAFEVIVILAGDFRPRLRGKEPVTPLLIDILRTVVFALFFFLAIKEAFPQADLVAMLTTSAILSVVLGLALQESLSNIFAGAMLTVDHPFKPGEWIEVDGKEGRILDSNWRSTRVHTRDDDVICVPNSAMARSNVLNFSAPTPLRLCKREVVVEYDAPPNKVRNVLVNLMPHTDGVLLKRNGMFMPYSTRDVYIRREKPERRPVELISILRRVDILASLKEGYLAMLVEDLSSRLFAKGEVVCLHGEHGSTFYILRGGSVAVIARRSREAEGRSSGILEKIRAVFGFRW